MYLPFEIKNLRIKNYPYSRIKNILSRGLVRGGARGAVAPLSFWDLLDRISKKVPINQPLLSKKKFAPLSSKC